MLSDSASPESVIIRNYGYKDCHWLRKQSLITVAPFSSNGTCAVAAYPPYDRFLLSKGIVQQFSFWSQTDFDENVMC